MEMGMDFIKKTKKDYFTYLDVLRETGITNMYGAPPYLANAFKLGKEEAREIVREWMEARK